MPSDMKPADIQLKIRELRANIARIVQSGTAEEFATVPALQDKMNALTLQILGDQSVGVSVPVRTGGYLMNGLPESR